jgi:hypothetical protein
MNLKNYARYFFITAVLFLLVNKFIAQVVINEFSCSNISTITDNFGDTPDWVELYNPGAAAIPLNGKYLPVLQYLRPDTLLSGALAEM